VLGKMPLQRVPVVQRVERKNRWRIPMLVGLITVVGGVFGLLGKAIERRPVSSSALAGPPT
jgi:hypothetical protein